MEKNYDDLFSGEPDQSSSSSPRAEGADNLFNSEDAAWEMRDQAVAEDQRHLDERNSLSTHLLNRPHISQTMDEIPQEDLRPELDIANSDDIYNGTDDPVLWEDSDDTFDTYDDDEFDMVDPRNIINSSPTEPELIVKGFEFHNRLSEKTKDRFFPEDYLRQACRDIDPTLPRKVQWRAWRAAEDRHCFLRNQANKHGENREEKTDNLYQSAVLNRRIVEAKPSLPPKNAETEIIHTRSATSSIPGLELSHASIVHSKPYLSDLNPAETRGQYPTLSPRSPQRAPSRASSLSSSAMPDAVGDIPEGLPFSAAKFLHPRKTNSANVEIEKDVPSPTKSELFEADTANIHIHSSHQGSSEDIGIRVYEVCTPSQKPLYSVEMESTRAVRGSPVHFHFDEMSRPDTPRPSVSCSNTYIHATTERQQPVSTWTDYRSSVVAPRSTSPSPSSLHSVGYTEDLDVSMTLKEEPDIRGVVDHDRPPLPLQQNSQIPGLHLSSTDQDSACPNLARSLDKIDSLHVSSTVQDESSGAERREAWLKFDEILQRAKDQVCAKSKSAPSPPTRNAGFPDLPQPSHEDMPEPQEKLQIRSQTLLSEARTVPVQTFLANNDLNAHVAVQCSNTEQPKSLPRLMEPWQEPCFSGVSSTGPTILSSEIASSTAELPQLQPEHISQFNFNDKMDPFADQPDHIHVSLRDSPSPGPSSDLVSALYQTKRGQRAATGVRNTTRGIAQPVKRSRGVSTKEKSSSTGRTVTGKTGLAAGVQGDNVKIQKIRASARPTSRKATNTGKLAQLADNVPAVPQLPKPEQMDIDENPLDQDLALPELTQEAAAAAAAAHTKAEAPNNGQSLQVNKTRKRSSPTKSRPATTKQAEEPKTPTRSTTDRRQDPRTSLTPQSTGSQATPRRRSPRLVEREQRARVKVAAAAAAAAATEEHRREETPVMEMDIDPPQTASKAQGGTDDGVEQWTFSTTASNVNSISKQKQVGKTTKRTN